jgi:hypothetical protein
MRGVTVGRSGIRHNGVEYATEVRLGSRLGAGAHTDECKKRVAEKKARRNLRGIERANGSGINLVEELRKTQRGQRTKDVQLGIFRATLSYPTLLYPKLRANRRFEARNLLIQ